LGIKKKGLNDVSYSRILAITMSTMAYVAALTGIILMYIWYAPKASCVLNIIFITSTVILLQVMTSISLHLEVDAGLMTTGPITSNGKALTGLQWVTIDLLPR